MSHILELLGRGLQHDPGDVLDRYFWSPSTRTLEDLRASHEIDPDDPEVNLRLGLAYLRGGHLEEAVRHLARACRTRPDDLAARLALASAWEQQGQPARALDAMEIANQIRPGEAPILFAIGFCLERMRRPLDAAEYYRDAVARQRNFQPARQRLAAVDLVLGELDEAIDQYQAMLRDEPDTAWIHAALAHLYFRAGRYADAVAKFEVAIALEPENWSLVDQQVEALVAEGQVREAIERLHELISAQDGAADLRVRLADLYSQAGDEEAATRFYLEAMDLEPNYLEARVKMGTHHLAGGRWDQAAETFHGAVELNDALLLNYVGMGVAQGAAGLEKDALNSFELAAAIEPNSTMLLGEVARLQLRSAAAEEFAKTFHGDPAPAPLEVELDNDDLMREQLQRHADRVRRRPNHADVRFRYGVLLRAEDRGAEALEQFAEAVRINPAYVQAIVRKGITEQELGLIDEAIETFASALEIRPEYVDVHYRLGLLYTDRRELEEAVNHMEAAAATADSDHIRASLALSFQNMGLMDRAAATWRSLCEV